MEQNKCNKCGRPMQYAAEPKCNYCDSCMSEYCGCKLGRIKEIEPTCDSTAVIPSITVESVEGITNLANCLVHVNDINTTFYVDDKHRVMITWAGPVDIPGYDMGNNPNGYRDQIVTDIEKGIAVIYDRHGKGFTFGIYQSLDADGSVTQAINDKLDEMAADGTLQDIIAEYIGEPIYGFDTVADMKASTTLKAGDRAKTLGFHTINDGGGAIYKISESGTANEMDIIACDNLYANLMFDGQINVKQLGAYGDDTHDDYAVINRAYTIVNTNRNNIILYIPKGKYKIESQLILKHIVINCEGTLDNDLTLILGANSSGSTTTNVYIYGANDIQIEGAKNSYFNLAHVGDITMYSDGNVNNNTSQAYNKIDGIVCASFTISTVNHGWINENEINIKRCRGNLTIQDDGTYPNNNNKFNDFCIEGDSRTISIDGNNNFVSYRGENNPSVVFGSNLTRCFGNSVKRQYSGLWSNELGSSSLNSVYSLNYVGLESQPSTKITRLLDLNPITVKTHNSNLALNGDGLITGNYVDEYVNSNIPADRPFTLILGASAKSQRFIITLFDSENNQIEGNVGGTGISWNSTNHYYVSGTDLNSSALTYLPSENVERIEIKLRVGTHDFEWATLDLVTPYFNIQNFYNTIDTTKKYKASAPTNRTWAVGDIIYNSAPTAGGTIGWVCVEAGTPGTWKAFGTISS